MQCKLELTVVKLLFVYSEWKWTEVCKVHYPIHLFTFGIVGGGYARPPGVLQGAL